MGPLRVIVCILEMEKKTKKKGNDAVYIPFFCLLPMSKSSGTLFWAYFFFDISSAFYLWGFFFPKRVYRSMPHVSKRKAVSKSFKISK